MNFSVALMNLEKCAKMINEHYSTKTNMKPSLTLNEFKKDN